MKEISITTGKEGRGGALQIYISNAGAKLATDENAVEIRFWLKPLHMNRTEICFPFHAGVASALAENAIAFRVDCGGAIHVDTDGDFRAQIYA